jgi:hypothetical protein
MDAVCVQGLAELNYHPWSRIDELSQKVRSEPDTALLRHMLERAFRHPWLATMGLLVWGRYLEELALATLLGNYLRTPRRIEESELLFLLCMEQKVLRTPLEWRERFAEYLMYHCPGVDRMAGPVCCAILMYCPDTATAAWAAERLGGIYERELTAA